MGFAEVVKALGQRRELDGAAAAVTGKTEKEEKRRRRRLGSYNTTQKLKEATTEPFPSSAFQARRGRPWHRAGMETVPSYLP